VDYISEGLERLTGMLPPGERERFRRNGLMATPAHIWARAVASMAMAG
jgi:hypothetical protein